MEFTFGNDETFCNLKLANMDNTSVYAQGLVKPSSWIKYIEVTRDMLASEILHKMSLVATNSIRIEFTPLFMDTTKMLRCKSVPLNVGKDVFLKQSFSFDCFITGVDGKDFAADFVIHNGNGQVLGTATSVNYLETSSSLSDNIYPPKFHGSHSKNAVHIIYKPNIKPATTFKSRYPVSFFDLDKQGNITLGACVDMCMNCLRESVLAHIPPSFYLEGDIIRTVNAVVFGKAIFGDTIDVEMWKNFSSFSFSLKSNRIDLCDVTMEFFAKGVSHNL